MMQQSKGLGDTIDKITTNTGVKKVINISSVSAYGFLETKESLQESQFGNQFFIGNYYTILTF